MLCALRYANALRLIVLVALAGVLPASAWLGAQAPPRVEPATLVLHNGRIVTVDDDEARGAGDGDPR